MAKIVFAGAMSHSPLMNFPIEKNHDQVERFKAAVVNMAERLHAAKPDAVVIFGPDHFRALFYDLMPAFVIGVDHVEGWGDWNTHAGPFHAHNELARHILKTSLEEGFEPAFSHDIKIDHGITQPLQLLDLLKIPIVPILINSAAPPLPAPKRCFQFGALVGRAIGSFSDGVRVAVFASGGLSHDPPGPSHENALHGRTNGFAASRERETSLMNRVNVLQARINPEWDRDVLAHFERGAVGTLADRLTTESIFDAAGNGGQEIRTWIAMAGATGDAPMRVLCYEPIDTLITGMGVVVT